MLARGGTLAALRRDGLSVFTSDGRLAGRPLVSDSPAELGLHDVAIVAVKAMAIATVAEHLPRLVRPSGGALFVGNGIPWWYYRVCRPAMRSELAPLLDPGERLARLTAGMSLAGGVIWSACTLTAPGVVRVNSQGDRMVFGWPGQAAASPLADVAALLEKGGLHATVTTDILDTIWTKLTGNVMSGLMALFTGMAPNVYSVEPTCLQLSREIATEVTAIAEAAGAPQRLRLRRVLAQDGCIAAQAEPPPGRGARCPGRNRRAASVALANRPAAGVWRRRFSRGWCPWLCCRRSPEPGCSRMPGFPSECSLLPPAEGAGVSPDSLCRARARACA
jgi:ketopantoate reductase